ncbi:sugar-binding protein [Sorangium sp. So ce128]|uniref:sugar-binding protein n=1 Tax=Sorangium sp. So ce128 TaxID=3133281 RepID=UPI003F6264A1
MRRKSHNLRALGAHASGSRLAALAPVALAALTAAAPSPALAAGTPIAAPLVESKWLKLDGIPKEWPVAFTSLGLKVKGKPSKADLAAQVAIAYDDARIYVAADVTDDALRGGADHVKVVLGFPGGKVQEVALYPGQPGKTAGSVKVPGGKAVAGARVIEAPRSGGYTLEASVPWTAFPEAATTRVGLRAGLFVHDDDGGGVDAVVGSAASEAYGSLSPLATEPELALTDGLLRSKGIQGRASYDLVADVAGDGMRERVLVHERFLVVLGPGFRKGAQYYFEDLGVDAKDGMVPSLTARDLTGDGQAELILRKRSGSSAKYREVIHVLQFGAGDTPKPIFQHEIAIATDKGSVVNDVDFVADGDKMAIRVEPGKATRYDASNYAEGVETTYDPLLLPWGSIKSQLYKLTGGVFTKASEQRQAGAAGPRPAPARAEEARAAPKPAGLSPAEMLDKVYALYRRDRSASSSKPRFDLGADVAAGKEPERVLLHDRDIVVFGKGFRGGAGYAFMTLAQFASPADIRSVRALDLTGDGKAEIIVHGTVRAAAPKEAGGGTVDRDVVQIFRVEGESIQRIFAAEVARSIGDKKIAGELKFVRVGDKMGIELAPGRAVEWTEQTYPFNQDKAPVGGFEPLLLPWGGAQPARYVWNGSIFAK